MRRLLLIVVVAALPLGVLLDVALGAKSPGLSVITGLIGAAVLILVPKAAVKRTLQRPETYYQDQAVD